MRKLVVTLFTGTLFSVAGYMLAMIANWFIPVVPSTVITIVVFALLIAAVLAMLGKPDWQQEWYKSWLE